MDIGNPKRIIKVVPKKIPSIPSPDRKPIPVPIQVPVPAEKGGNERKW